MHLSNLPTVFVKDGVERKAYHTVEARELIADGWVEAGEAKASAKRAPKVEVVEEKPKTEKPKAAPIKAVTTEAGTEK